MPPSKKDSLTLLHFVGLLSAYIFLAWLSVYTALNRFKDRSIGFSYIRVLSISVSELAGRMEQYVNGTLQFKGLKEQLMTT